VASFSSSSNRSLLILVSVHLPAHKNGGTHTPTVFEYR
jgi:hypothetical protein